LEENKSKKIELEKKLNNSNSNPNLNSNSIELEIEINKSIEKEREREKEEENEIEIKKQKQKYLDNYMNIINHLDCMDKNEFSITIFKPFDEKIKSIKNIQNIFKENYHNDNNDKLELEIMNSLIPSFNNLNLLDIKDIFTGSESSIIYIDDIDRKKDKFSLDDTNIDPLFSLFHKLSLEKRNIIRYLRCFKNDKECKIVIDLIKLNKNHPKSKSQSQSQSLLQLQYPIIVGLKGIPNYNRFFNYVIYKDFNITNTKNILDGLGNEMIKNENEKNKKLNNYDNDNYYFDFKFPYIEEENQKDIAMPFFKINENNDNDDNDVFDYKEYDNKFYNFSAIDLENELDKRDNNTIFIIYTYEKSLIKEVKIK
jgi:hypothetical protein